MTFCASKTVNGVTTNHIWDGSNIVAETDGNKQVTAKYYRGSGLISQEVSNTESYYQFNMHGDVIGLTGANGELIEDYDYDAFGNQINQSTEKSTPFRYAGEYYDEETDLIYLRNRYYSPIVGQFITEDPAKDGTNWYVYCAGDPVNLVDPSGLDAWIYYGKDQYEAAQRDAEIIRSKYPGEEVFLVFVDTPDDLINEWESMDGDISYVEINLHGDPQNIYSGDGQSIDISKLKDKEIETLVNFACNQDHLDVKNNVTDQLFENNTVNNMIASDGTVWWTWIQKIHRSIGKHFNSLEEILSAIGI